MVFWHYFRFWKSVQMIKVQKTFFRIIFFLLIFGGFFGQSFASLLYKNGNSKSSNSEFRSPTKKTNYSPFLFFDSEEEFGEKEDSLDEDEWDDGDDSDLPTLNAPAPHQFGRASGSCPIFSSSQTFFRENTFSNSLERPLYDRFHQWKFDLIVNF